MEIQQENSSKKVMINYGLILGLISILISVGVYASGNAYNQHWSIGLISFAIMVILIALGIKKLKQNNNDSLTLAEALKTGIGIALISGILSAIYTYIFVTIIEPDFYVNLLASIERQWMEQGMTDEQIQTTLAMTKKMSGPFMTITFSIIGSLFFGFIISLITGLIMKKDKAQ